MWQTNPSLPFEKANVRRSDDVGFWQGIAGSGIADVLEQVSVAVNAAAQLLFEDIPQVQMLDIYRLSAVSVQNGKCVRVRVDICTCRKATVL